MSTVADAFLSIRHVRLNADAVRIEGPIKLDEEVQPIANCAGDKFTINENVYYVSTLKTSCPWYL